MRPMDRSTLDYARPAPAPPPRHSRAGITSLTLAAAAVAIPVALTPFGFPNADLIAALAPLFLLWLVAWVLALAFGSYALLFSEHRVVTAYAGLVTAALLGPAVLVWVVSRVRFV